MGPHGAHILYMKDTIEERMLAYREKESQFAKKKKKKRDGGKDEEEEEEGEEVEEENDLSVLSDNRKEQINNDKLFFICGLSETNSL